jgi:hypothetical protein
MFKGISGLFLFTVGFLAISLNAMEKSDLENLKNSPEELVWASGSCDAQDLNMVLKALEINKYIHTVDLTIDYMNSDATKAIAAFLKKDLRLKRVKLQQNNLDENGLKALGEALKVNSSLTEINFSHIHSEEGLKALVTAIESNKSLTSIKLACDDKKIDMAPYLERISVVIKRNIR